MNKQINSVFINQKFTILIVMASLFMGIGYAAVNSVIIDIKGTVVAKAQDGVYITDVYYDSDINADLENSKIINAYQTMLNSSIALSDVDANSSITYAITVYNSSDETYYFDKVDYLGSETTYSNEDIVFEINGLSHDDTLDSKNSLTFTITFYYKDGVLSTNNILSSYLNFSFRKMYTISYVNVYSDGLPNTVLGNDSITIDLSGKAPSNIQVYIDDVITTDYTYTNYSFDISNVMGNIKIVGVVGKPNLTSSNLVPILYDGENWQVTDSDNWCDYGKQEWCNAAILKSSVSLNVGNIVDVDNDVRAMFVWIPRYEYKISTDGSNEILINFIEKGTTTASSGYIIHPAFTFGNYQLDGIWVGKFETSTSKDSICYTNPSLDNCGSDVDVYILPNVKSLREQTISVQFNTARNFSQYLTDSSLNSHMLKNSEWSAVAYLSQSKYGKYGNKNYTGSNKEVYINNSWELYTGMSSGSYTNQDNSFQYNYGFENGLLISEENGVGASTTGNITGIFDMNGGTYEYVMGYLSTASSTFGSTSYYNYAGFTSAPESKYYDNYTSSTSSLACNGKSCYGHGFDEVSGWYDDASDFLTVDNPWVMRGGVFDGGVSSGIFAYTATIGYSGAYATFRMALVEEN